MTTLRLFDFGESQIRVVGTLECPKWIARDVAQALGIPRTTLHRRLRKMPEQWKGVYQMDTPGGQQEMITVTEPGLYTLIFRSDKPEALQFQKWVVEEVLPSLRQTGHYELRPEVEKTLRMDAEAVINSMDRVIDEREKLEREKWEIETNLHYAMKCIDAHGIKYREKDWW